MLCIILWFNFRSVRDTAYVMVLAVLAIGATYGLSGWLQFAGIEMTFNAAMNSIPVLLLAIGVDYGLHVVARIRRNTATALHRTLKRCAILTSNCDAVPCDTAPS